MARDKKKKGKKMKRNLRDMLDDNDREQVEPGLEPDEEDQHERWALPGDDERSPEKLPRITALRDGGVE
jgi:hypothetical protein